MRIGSKANTLSRSAICICIYILCSINYAVADSTIIKSVDGPYRMYDQSFALIIGASAYQNKLAWPILDVVPAEVLMMKKRLEQLGFVTSIKIDPDAASLSQVIKEFVTQKVSRDTRLLVYFAGHGWTDGVKTGYMVPVDALEEGNPKFLGKLVSMEEIKAISHASAAKHLLFIFDSCFSGSVFMTRRGSHPPNQMYLRDIDRPGIQFITSGTAEEEVPDSLEFSSFVDKGLSGDADYNKDGIVTASELGYYLRNKIIPLNKQTPQFGSDSDSKYRAGDEIFVVNVNDKENIKVLVDPPGGTGPRRAILRGIGEPTDPRNQIFEGVEVLYYEKIADQGVVQKALSDNGIPFFSTRAVLPERLQANALACGDDVPVGALKATAKALLQAGVKIQEIKKFNKPADKPKRIEIVSVTDDLKAFSPMNRQSIDLQTVEDLRSCPNAIFGRKTE